MTEVQQYTPKVGDRVRVTRVWEGTVGSTECTGFRVDGEMLGPWFDFHPSADNLSRGLVAHTVEKLADPEPTWVNGDVIEAGGSMFARLGGQWRDTETGDYPLSLLITNYWKAGMVEILYKADQPDGSSAVGKADAQKVA